MNTTSTTSTSTARPLATALTVAAVVALVLLLAEAPFFLASGLMAPGWAVAVLVGCWLLLLALGVVWLRRHPVRVLPLPVVGAAVWFAAMYLGEALLGWTA